MKLPKRGGLDQYQISDMGGWLQQKLQQGSETSPFEWLIKWMTPLHKHKNVGFWSIIYIA